MSQQPEFGSSLGGPATPVPPFDTHSLTTTYSNYFRASGDADELILDFGLDSHRQKDDAEPIVLRQRVVLTWGNAKRLLLLLHELVQRHDKIHANMPLGNALASPNRVAPPA